MIKARVQDLAIFKHLQIFLRDLVILLGSVTVSNYFYGIFAFGIDQTEIVWGALYPSFLFILLVSVVVLCVNLALPMRAEGWHGTGFREQFWSLSLAIALTTGYIVLISANILQAIVFAGISFFIAFCFTIWAAVNPLPSSDSSLLKTLRRLWGQRYLIGLWTRYDLEAQYVDSRLGSVWIVLQPLISALVYTIIFGLVFNVREVTGDTPFVVFFLAGIVYWQLYAQSTMRGANAVLKERGILKQIQIPIDTLIVITFASILVDFGVMFVVMLVINLVFGVLPSFAYLYIPLILAIQILISLGFMFLAGSLTVFSRDIPQVIGSFIRLLFYFSAIIYPISAAPKELQAFLMFNPLALLVDNFRNIVIAGTAPNFFQLMFPLMLGITLFFAGFRFLKSNEKRFIDLM